MSNALSEPENCSDWLDPADLPYLTAAERTEWEALTSPDATTETARCRDNPAHFISDYCAVYDATSSAWLPFHLWPAQRDDVLPILHSPAGEDRQIVILKARQLGLTWLCLAWLLHLALFRPHSTVLLFSRRDDEAMDLLQRMAGMHKRLPDWLRNNGTKGNAHDWPLANGSRVMAFPTGTGDSYTATAVLIDEADLLTPKEQDQQIRAVKPTVDAGGKLVLLSRSNKSQPISPFKAVYRGAVESKGRTGWRPIFLPWHARPSRTAEWFGQLEAEILARTGSLDERYEQYPATDTEALSARSLDKRLPPQWLDACYRRVEPLDMNDYALHGLLSDCPSMPQFKVFVVPQPGRRYVIGADPAEGLPDSDDSAMDVLDRETGEQAATFAAKVTPAMLASVVAKAASWYNQAAVLVERNSHGVGFIQWMNDNAQSTFLLCGRDNRPGWQQNSSTKPILYDAVAEVFRLGQTIVHDFGTRTQLGDIEIATLSAPEGQHDDKAMSYALSLMAIECSPRGRYELL